ncbi:hypothetical protein CK203_024689 [Vitis vinifera]|uniref:EF-hand domain-containing protein n=1 Tax=Vitis vinifera TaxID=29760 RepID=A0A438ITK5_VITVI|nr:hypothetical protein CK203_024689 [Vitis vinifera]
MCILLSQSQILTVFIYTSVLSLSPHRHDTTPRHGITKRCTGRLNKAELKQAFQHLGALIPGWRAHRALHHADADGDGCISEKEMKDLVEYAAKFGYRARSAGISSVTCR